MPGMARGLAIITVLLFENGLVIEGINTMQNQAGTLHSGRKSDEPTVVANYLNLVL